MKAELTFRKNIIHLVIIVLIVGYASQKLPFNSTKQLVEYRIIDNYKNYFVSPEATGTVYKIDSSETNISVLVIWDNGFYSVGKLKNNIAIGPWFLFDKKNRLRRYIGFSNVGKDIPVVKEYNKKGDLIRLTPSSISF